LQASRIVTRTIRKNNKNELAFSKGLTGMGKIISAVDRSSYQADAMSCKDARSDCKVEEDVGFARIKGTDNQTGIGLSYGQLLFDH